MKTPSAKFRDYLVKDSGKSVEEVFAHINEAVYWGHCQEDSTVRINSLARYRTLLEKITELGIVTVPFSEVDLTKKPPANQVTCLIRHDLDIDIVAAYDMAKLEKLMGVRSSWFVLHTSPYYGEYDEKSGIFYRNGCLRHVYRILQDEFNHEIALHTDGLNVYQGWGVDGAAAVVDEVEWLRASGLRITGSTAHNSHGVYGAENFAIFKGMPQFSRAHAKECPDFVEKDGKVALLHQIDPSSLGLTYEANQIFWQSEGGVRYGATRGEEEWRWKSNMAKGASVEPVGTDGMVSEDSFIENLKYIKDGEWLVLVIHPVYYGSRVEVGYPVAP